MYYSSGNYEAFATPKKPEGVEHKSAYLIGSGLAALTAACYLVRDGQMKGGHVHVFEKDPIPGGACDGYKYDVGYVMRGAVRWTTISRSCGICCAPFRLWRPRGQRAGRVLLAEQGRPNYSLCRATVNCGEDAHTDGKFGLSDKAPWRS